MLQYTVRKSYVALQRLDHMMSYGEAERCLAGIVRGGDLLQTGLHAPDLPGILRNSAVTGEFTAAGNVMDHLLCPLFRVLLGDGRRIKGE